MAGNFILLPLALAFGRRPIFLASTAILFVALIGAALQNSYDAHLGIRVLLGLATGATESVLPLMLTEVTFLADRGKIMSLYWGSQNLFTAVLTITASYEVHALGWQWYYWVFAILIGAGLVFVVFGAFETAFQRPLASIDGQVVKTDEFGVTTIIPDDQALEYLDVVQEHTQLDASIPRTSYLQRLKPVVECRPHPARLILTTWLNMAVSLTSPALLFVVLISSMALSGTIYQSLTYATTLISLSWNPKDVGLINIVRNTCLWFGILLTSDLLQGALVGSCLAMAYAAFVADPVIIWMTRRNKGVFQPEFRLITSELYDSIFSNGG